jgi:hypothetical protein
VWNLDGKRASHGFDIEETASVQLGGMPTYLANLCPIFCDGLASHSRPRTAILHNRGVHCKRFCQSSVTHLESSRRRGFSGSHA